MSPATRQSTGAIDHLIPVLFDPILFTLTVRHPSVAVRSGDRVLWRFEGLPPGWTPWIEFRHGGPLFLGPFASLAQGATEIWGPCRDDLVPGSIPYRAVVQRGLGGRQGDNMALASSNTAELSVHPRDDGKTLIFTVDFDENRQKLLVAPERVIYETLDVIQWDFLQIPGLPGEYRPRVDFFLHDGGTPVPNLLLGPFSSLTYGAGTVTGMGNSGFQGEYHFEVSLVRIATGEAVWVGSGDPVIDNRGSLGP